MKHKKSVFSAAVLSLGCLCTGGYTAMSQGENLSYQVIRLNSDELPTAVKSLGLEEGNHVFSSRPLDATPEILEASKKKPLSFYKDNSGLQILFDPCPFWVSEQEESPALLTLAQKFFFGLNSQEQAALLAKKPLRVAELNSQSVQALRAILLFDTAHLVADSSYAQDWSSLASRVEDLDTMAFVVSSDADLQSVVRLASGAEKLVPPPAPKLNEPFPDFALRLPDGKSWETRDARGKTALALLLNPDSMPGAERALEQAQDKTDKIRLATVSAVSTAKVPVATSALVTAQNPNAPLHLLDARRDVLAPYGTQTRLLLIDRAGWVRGTSTPKDAAALQASLNSAHDFTPALVVGRPAPDFTMPDMNGQLRRSSEVRGQSNLLLTFFPKCFTGGCSNHLTLLRNKAVEFEAANTKIWAVSIDPADVQIAFAKSLSLPFPLLSDTGRHLSFLYNAAQSVDDLSARQSILIDKTGVVRWIEPDVYVQTHGADVLAKINELGLG